MKHKRLYSIILAGLMAFIMMFAIVAQAFATDSGSRNTQFLTPEEAAAKGGTATTTTGTGTASTGTDGRDSRFLQPNEVDGVTAAASGNRDSRFLQPGEADTKVVSGGQNRSGNFLTPGEVPKDANGNPLFGNATGSTGHNAANTEASIPANRGGTAASGSTGFSLETASDLPEKRGSGTTGTPTEIVQALMSAGSSMGSTGANAKEVSGKSQGSTGATGFQIPDGRSQGSTGASAEEIALGKSQGSTGAAGFQVPDGKTQGSTGASTQDYTMKTPGISGYQGN